MAILSQRNLPAVVFLNVRSLPRDGRVYLSLGLGFRVYGLGLGTEAWDAFGVLRFWMQTAQDATWNGPQIRNSKPHLPSTTKPGREATPETLTNARKVHTAVSTHRLLSSSLLGLPYRILNINHKEELLRSLWVSCTPLDGKVCAFRATVTKKQRSAACATTFMKHSKKLRG